MKCGAQIFTCEITPSKRKFFIFQLNLYNNDLSYLPYFCDNFVK